MKLTSKQQRFCDEYLIDLNGTQAAIRAGYSENAAKEIAAQNLTKLNIQTYLSEAKKKLSDRNENLADRVVEELQKIGFCNIQDYLETGNVIKDLTTIERPIAAAVSSIKRSVTEFGTIENPGIKTVIEFKLHDKISALEKLGRYCGIFEKDNSQSKPEITQPLNDSQVDRIISSLREAS